MRLSITMTNSFSSAEEAALFLRSKGWGVYPPDQYINDLDSLFMEFWGKAEPYSMISIERAWDFARAVRHISKKRIEGDIVECGVWKGGACLLASDILSECEPGTSRNIWLYDTFSGMNKPTGSDKIILTGEKISDRNPEGWWAAGKNEVLNTLKLSNLDIDHFILVEGPVEETLYKNIPDKISVLRLDTDWYESTKAELEVLFPKLSAGGFLLIDDYGHFSGSKKAVDEYFEKSGIIPYLHRSDYTGRVYIKD